MSRSEKDFLSVMCRKNGGYFCVCSCRWRKDGDMFSAARGAGREGAGGDELSPFVPDPVPLPMLTTPAPE